MSIISRSVSFVRYRVKGDVDGSFWDSIHEGIQRYRFRSTGDGFNDIIGKGWVSIADFTDTGLEGTSYAFSNYVALSFRVDTVRVPARTLEIRVREASKVALEVTGQKRLTAAQRREIKEDARQVLRKEIVPSIQVYDLVWNTATATAYITTHSTKARELVEDHFKKSFGLTLVPLIPYLRAEETLDKEGLGKLANVAPQVW